MELFCLAMEGCQTVYPVALFRQNSQFKNHSAYNRVEVPSYLEILHRVLTDLHAARFKLMRVDADTPVRAKIINFVGAPGLYACGICIAKRVDVAYAKKTHGDGTVEEFTNVGFNAQT